MENSQKYKSIFLQSLGVGEDVFNEEIKYNEIPEWDSIGHMSLISSIEEEFKISIETDDIIDFSGYEKGKEILSQKYKINF